MSLSDNPIQRSRPPVPSRQRGAEGKWWGDSQKLEAVKTHLLLGSYRLTAAVVKIPEETIKRWSKTDWWKELRNDLLQEEELQMSSRLQRLVDKSLSVVEDRLDNGDFVYDQKTGAMRRKPVNMRDAHKVALDMQDKRELLLNNSSPRASEEQVSDKLLKLAEKFAELAGKKKIEVNTLDAEVVDVEAKAEEVSPDPLSDELSASTGTGTDCEMVQEEETPSS